MLPEPSNKPNDFLRKEIIRKLFHMSIIVVLPVAAISKGVLVLGIVAASILYLAYEAHVRAGGSIPIITDVFNKAKRIGESEIAHAPFLMAAGVIITVLVFPFKPAAAGLFQLAFCDMAAALVGITWGKHNLPHAPKKSWEGTIAFFLMGAVLMSFIYPWYVGIFLALIGAAIESLPYKDWDNLLIPVGVAAIASFF
jgi:phytol kinase